MVSVSNNVQPRFNRFLIVLAPIPTRPDQSFMLLASLPSVKNFEGRPGLRHSTTAVIDWPFLIERGRYLFHRFDNTTRDRNVLRLSQFIHHKQVFSAIVNPKPAPLQFRNYGKGFDAFDELPAVRVNLDINPIPIMDFMEWMPFMVCVVPVD
jgi:hypothetical protein